MSSSALKAPIADLDWKWDWGIEGNPPWLETGEVITDHVVTTSDPVLTIASTAADDATVTAWLTGGTAGDRYTVTCQITTNAGRTDERSIIISVVDR